MTFVVHKDINAVFTIKGAFEKLWNNDDRKRLVRDSLFAGGEFFRLKYMPLRFSDYVYRLGYRVTEDWKKYKRRVTKFDRAVPFIGLTPPGGGDSGSLIAKRDNDEKMTVAMIRGCKTSVSNTAKGGNIKIKTPFGHAITTFMASVFNKVLPSEYEATERVVRSTFKGLLAEAVPLGGRSKRMVIPGSSSHWKPGGREAKKRDGAGTTRQRK